MSSPVFNPDLPMEDSPIVSLELRNQLNSLNNLANDANGNAEGRAWMPSSVTPLSMTVSNPPTQAQVQAIANKVDELLAALVL